jgi:hypothetical protein
MTQEEFNNLKIGDKVKFHCFDRSTIVVKITNVDNGIVYGKSQFGSHWANISDVEIM